MEDRQKDKQAGKKITRLEEFRDTEIQSSDQNTSFYCMSENNRKTVGIFFLLKTTQNSDKSEIYCMSENYQKTLDKYEILSSTVGDYSSYFYCMSENLCKPCFLSLIPSPLVQNYYRIPIAQIGKQAENTRNAKIGHGFFSNGMPFYTYFQQFSEMHKTRVIQSEYKLQTA